MIPTTRVCKKCGEEKPLEELIKKPGCKYGRAPMCLDCSKEYTEKNRGKIKIRTDEYREKNRGKIKIRRSSHYKENSKKIKELSRVYREENPEKVIEMRAKEYIAKQGISRSQIPGELLKYKVQQLKLNRKIKQLKTSPHGKY